MHASHKGREGNLGYAGCKDYIGCAGHVSIVLVVSRSAGHRNIVHHSG